MKTYLTKDDVEMLLMACPNRPLFYWLYIRIDEGSSIPTLTKLGQQMHSKIKEMHIALDHIEKILIWSKKDIKMSPNELARTLQIYSEFIFRTYETAIDLPFVPEIAHDQTRMGLLINQKYHSIPPITCEIFPTINCLNRCTQCAYKMHKIAAGVWCNNNLHDDRWHMNIDLVNVIVDRIRKAGVKYLVITGGGDPLMNFDVTLDILKKSNDLREKEGWDVKTGIYTNANTVSPKSALKITDILKHNPEFIRISMNAASKKTYDRHHNPFNSSYNYMEDNIKPNVISLLRKKYDKNLKTRIGISYLIDPITIKDVKEFADWVYQHLYVTNGLKVDFIRFTPTIDYFSHMQYSQEFFQEAVQKIKEEAYAPLVSTGAQVTLYNHRFDHIKEKKGYDKCLGNTFFMEVGCDGQTYVCCETAFFPGYILGDLLKRDYSHLQETHLFTSTLRRINESKLKSCPTFCKPHNINKIICEIDDLINADAANKARIKNWLDGLNSLWNWNPPHKSSFIKPQFVAF